MHVPDGFLDAPTSVATGVVAAAADRRARCAAPDASSTTVPRPMAGLVATFVFAAQMINFPVGAGTSGHLLGGALAAVLVGPWTAVLCLSVVLLVQALLIADGGITALGTNITLIGLVDRRRRLGGLRASCAGCCPSGSAWSPRRPPSRPWSPCPSRRWSSPGSSRSAATLPVDAAKRPDGDARLAHRHRDRRGRHHRPGGRERDGRAARPGLRRPPAPRRARARDPATGVDAMSTPHASSPSRLLVSLLVAGVASYYASCHPDGLEYVAEQTGFSRHRRGLGDLRQPAGRLPASRRRRRPPQRRPRRRDRRGS